MARVVRLGVEPVCNSGVFVIVIVLLRQMFSVKPCVTLCTSFVRIVGRLVLADLFVYLVGGCGSRKPSSGKGNPTSTRRLLQIFPL